MITFIHEKTGQAYIIFIYLFIYLNIYFYMFVY